MKCIYCGNEAEEGRKYCGVCGAIISGNYSEVTGEETDRGPESVRQFQIDGNTQVFEKNSAPTQQNMMFNERNEMFAGSRTANKPSQNKKPLRVAAVLGAVMVAAAIIVALGMFVFGWFDDSGPQHEPEATVRVAVNALNHNNSKAFFNCFKPEVKNEMESKLKTTTSGFGTMFGGTPPNSYSVVDKSLEYSKFVLGIDKIEVRDTSITTGDVNGKADFTGSVYFGAMNMGKVVFSLEMSDSMWYIINVDTRAMEWDSIKSLLPFDGSKIIGAKP